MKPPAVGCSVSEAFSLEPFSQGHQVDDFDGFGNNSFESVLKQPNINQPPVNELPNLLEFGQQGGQQQGGQQQGGQQQGRQQQGGQQQGGQQQGGQQQGGQQQGGQRQGYGATVHRDIHIVNNGPRQLVNNRPRQVINRPRHMNIQRPVVNNTYVNKTKYVKHSRKKQNDDNNWLWIIIGILIFLNIVLSVMYVRK